MDGDAVCRRGPPPLWSAAHTGRPILGVIAFRAKAENHVVDIFDEVDEDLRAERTQALLKRYGGLLVGACVAVIAATGGWQAWEWNRARQDMQAATAYVTGMLNAEATANQAGRGVATTVFDSLSNGAPAGYQVLSRLRAASLKADAGDIQGATQLWDQVAGDTAADPLLRDLASLLWASRQLDQADPAILEARLRPLAAPNNAWHTLATERIAMLNLRQGKTDAAKEALRQLAADPTAPNGVRARAGALGSRL